MKKDSVIDSAYEILLAFLLDSYLIKEFISSFVKELVYVFRYNGLRPLLESCCFCGHRFIISLVKNV